ncbi:hypothetical protein [Mesorhizobium sp.]|uniref:hypothetical protein n=1 Tax=Mesorhizobium sp. TaxID=1871066 RepID=UPI000FE43E05|nr:hypothetical protein [Mesorhizobium sp.]RWI35523.1 MAG: hypothetical protein EOR14_28895 [Mesorhizobium sp.]RWJ03459.1 MAG: hypothetical protein EOR24_32275 [Mesorhizobium sp.]RWJ66308.1 MAG: hypothetical protein EOR34_28240 [Mesorhizobium sp.]
MSSSDTRLYDALAKILGPSPAEDVMELITETVGQNPGAIEELFPGKKLVDRKMSSAERSRLMTAAGAKAREQAARERYAIALPHVKRATEANPAITLREIAKVLDDAGVKPLRADKWSAPSVLNLLKAVGLREPTKT